MPTSTLTTVYLSIGSNMGDRVANIEAALDALGHVPMTGVKRWSGFYESRAWGKTDQDDFLNMVAEVETRLEPRTLLRHLQSIEQRLGREVGGERWGPRPIDIDVLLFGERTLRTASLQVPHPHMWERHFVLRPLAELLPDLVAPDGTPIAQLLEKSEISEQGLTPYGGKQEDDGSEG